MTQDLTHFTVGQLKGFTLIFPGILMGGQLFISDEIAGDSEYFKYPSRLDVYFLIFCIEGSFEVSINLNDYRLTKGMAIVYTPDSIMQIKNSSESVVRAVALTDAFLQGIQIDPQKIFSSYFNIYETPCLQMNNKELIIVFRYLKLIRTVWDMSDQTYKMDIIKGLISSVVYLFVNIWEREKRQVADQYPAKDRTTRHFEQFMNLLYRHHRQEHNVNFYAGKMGLTAKHLSSVIKKHSGKSAAEWIDEYLILEAKSMIKFSGRSIQEIAYELNFSDHSFFCKYFKNHTGMTPVQYRTT